MFVPLIAKNALASSVVGVTLTELPFTFIVYSVVSGSNSGLSVPVVFQFIENPDTFATFIATVAAEDSNEPSDAMKVKASLPS